MTGRVVTVIGANGTMGANVSGIFASFGKAKVYMLCRNISDAERAAERACASVRAESIRENLIPADYSMLPQCVAESDIVFESAAENIEIKCKIAQMVSSNLNADAISCSGSSGLSLTVLAECYPEELRGNFFGVHMFNPPYSMPLCELIVTKYSNACLKESLKDYLEKVLLRTVVEVPDTPAFLANRIGFQFINAAMQNVQKYSDNGGIDYIDAILGPHTGRMMAPLATADFVGLDVHKAIVSNVYANTNDYANGSFCLPGFAEKLINEHRLGRKSGEGLYKSVLSDTGRKKQLVYDIASGSYRERIAYSFPFAEKMKDRLRNGDYQGAFSVLLNNHSKEAEICVDFLLNYIVYALYTARTLCANEAAAEYVMASGFNWCPPLAMVQAFSSVTSVEGLIKERLHGSIPDDVEIKDLLAKAEQTPYDYRPFFRAV